MGLISVEQALDILTNNAPPAAAELIATQDALGRVPANDVLARLTQPPFDSSAMDGYAVRSQDTMSGSTLSVVGTSAAGKRYEDTIEVGQAVRIFTGAPVPKGADAILIQENATQIDVNSIKADDPVEAGRHIRRKGNDFVQNDTIWPKNKRLTPYGLSLVAAANVAQIEVYRRPKVAILSTGDELVPLGADVGDDQIVASNGVGLKALFESLGADVQLHESAADELNSLGANLGSILAQHPDILITIGGVSVGDKDLVAAAIKQVGAQTIFHGVAVRPGKPLLYAKCNTTHILGLPGNPISSLVSARLFVTPLLLALSAQQPPLPRRAELVDALPKNGPRAFYMRAQVTLNGDSGVAIHAHKTQDSAHLSSFAQSNALLVRPPYQPALEPGELVEYLPLD